MLNFVSLNHLSIGMTREDAKSLSAGMESGVTWRKVGIIHRTTNEILVDIIESLDAIIDQRGMIVTAEISGVVNMMMMIARNLQIMLEENSIRRLLITKNTNFDFEFRLIAVLN